MGLVLGFCQVNQKIRYAWVFSTRNIVRLTLQAEENKTIRLILFSISISLFVSCTTILRTREEVKLPEHMIAITLDDGPSETEFVDEQILDLLKEKNIKACFCLLTYKLPGKSAILARIIAEGHTIAFHSRNHELYFTKSFDQFKEDLADFEAAIHNETGLNYKVEHIRPPVGVLSASLAHEIESAGLKILYSTHNPTDTFVSASSSKQYLDRLIVEFQSSRGGIVVFHTGSELFPRPTAKDFANDKSPANRRWVPAAVGRFIEELSAQGFRFVGVDEFGT